MGQYWQDFPEVFRPVLANVSSSKNRSVSRVGVEEDLARRQELDQLPQCVGNTFVP